MRNLLLAVSMILILGPVRAQTEQRIFFETKEETFKPYDSSYYNLRIFQSFLKQTQGNGLAETEKVLQTDSSFISKLSAIDLDGDDDLDIVYQGPSVVELERVSFFLNVDKEMKYATSFGGRIQYLEFKNKHLDRLYVREEGCCGDFKAHNYILRLNAQKNRLSFDTIWHSIEGYYTEFARPNNYYVVPFQIVIQYDGYNLRSGPEVIDPKADADQEEVPGYRFSGNIIAKLKQGSSGWVIASELDNKGRLWYLVVLGSRLDFKEFMGFPDEYDNKPFRAIGWLSSRFVKRIEE